MTEQQRKIRRRRRMKRNFKRAMYSILTAPVRMPRLSRAEVGFFTRACELSGVLLVVTLLICMLHASTVVKVLCVISAVLFVASMVVIQLQMYQDRLEDHGYEIQRNAF